MTLQSVKSKQKARELSGNTRSYALWKDGHRIVIQAPPLPDANKVPWDASQSLELVTRLDREYLYDLEHIVRTHSVIYSSTHLLLIAQSTALHRIWKNKLGLYAS
jgi:hypothetical protein